MKPSRLFWQIALLSTVTFATTAPALFGWGRLPITPAHMLFAGKRFAAGLSPYVLPDVGSYFKYSPFFAQLFVPFTWVSDRFASFAWSVLSIVVFWWGLSLWFRFSKSSSRWMWFGLLLASMEVDGGIRHLQANAFLTGLMMAGLWAFSQRRDFGAAALLTFATSIKVFPGMLIAVLFPSRRSHFIIGVGLASAATVLLPAWSLGLDGAYEMHRAWISVLIENSRPGGFKDILPDAPQRMLHIANVVGFYGYRPFGEVLEKTVLLVTLLVLGATALKPRDIPWSWWVPMAMAAMLLVSPGTEPPTFCILAPAYLFLMARFSSGPERNKLKLGMAIGGMALITLVYNDVWPRILWDPRLSRSVSKTFGTFLIWSLCLNEALVFFWRERVPRRTPVPA